MNKERWEYLKKLKVPKPILLWDSGKRMIKPGIWTRGVTYRKKEHGPLNVQQKESK